MNTNWQIPISLFPPLFLVLSLLPAKCSVQIIIDHDQQEETLESVHIENPARLLEQLTALELGRRRPTMQIIELSLENLFFIGNIKDLVLDSKLINLDSYFVQATCVSFSQM